MATIPHRRQTQTLTMPPKSVGVSGNPAIRSVFWQREQGGRPPAAAVQQLAECRQLWPGGVDTAARLEAAIQALGGDAAGPAPRLPVCPGPARPAGRRAALLRPGLTRAALLVCPLHLGVGPINGDQADCPGRPPPGSVRRPGERLVLRFGEINHETMAPTASTGAKLPQRRF